MVARDFANIKEAVYELLDYHDIDTDKNQITGAELRQHLDNDGRW